MKKLFTGLFLIAYAVFLSGCGNYDFVLSLNQGLPLDDALVGTWRNDNIKIDISKKSRTEYKVIYTSKQLKSTTTLEGYPIKIGTQRFVQMSVKNYTDADGRGTQMGNKDYLVISYSIQRNELTIKSLIFKAATQAELKQAVISNQPGLYGDSDKFLRAPTSEVNPRWVTSISKDPITDELKSVAYNMSVEKNSVLFVKCSNASLDIVVGWNHIMEDLFDKSDWNASLVYVRWDSAPAEKMMWDLSPTNRETYSYNQSAAGTVKNLLLPFSILDYPKAYRNRDAEVFTDDAGFVRHLLNHESLVIRGTNINNEYIDSTFDIRNTAGSFEKNLGSCLSRYGIALD